MEILKVINLPVHEYINSLYSSCFSMKFYYFHKIVHAYVIMLQKQENTYNIKTWSFGVRDRKKTRCLGELNRWTEGVMDQDHWR